MLTEGEIRELLAHLEWRTVYHDVDARIRVQKQKSGYSEDSGIGVIQAKLSIMLEAVTK